MAMPVCHIKKPFGAIDMIEQILVIVGITALVMVSPGPDMLLVTRNTLVATSRRSLDIAGRFGR